MPRSAWVALALVVLLGCGLIAARLAGFQGGRVLRADASAPWIMAPEPFSALNRQWGLEKVRPVQFRHSWTLSKRPSEAADLQLRAFGLAWVWINGLPIPFNRSPDRRWSEFQSQEVSAALQEGTNEILVEIRNRRGPSLLAARLDMAQEGSFSTAAGFEVRRGQGPWQRPVPAQDIRRHPAHDWLPTAAEGWARHLWALVGAGVVGAWLGFCSAWLAKQGPRWGLRLVWTGVGLFWGLLWIRTLEMPWVAGFDARGHIEVIELIASGQLPKATDGWSTYHPPFYHAVAAGLNRGVAVFDLHSMVGVWAMRLPAWLAGLGLVFWTARLAGTIAPDRLGVRAGAIALAALLPVNLSLATTISNEGWLAFLVAGAIVQAARVVSEDHLRPWGLASVSIWLGLALLTKYTALVAAAVIAILIGVRILTGPKRRSIDRVREAIFFLVPATGIAGWYYARNLWLYGRVLVPNWDLPGSTQAWWSPPGFHTWDYYLGFGRVLSEPFYASFASFWDGLYSTFWGDGLLSGAPSLPDVVVPWNLEWMAAGYWAALPLTLLMILGLFAWGGEVLREKSALRAGSLGLPLIYAAAMVFAILFATLSLPFFGQSRASYGLSAVPVLALGFARGWAWLEEWVPEGVGRHLMRAALAACFTLWGWTSVMAFLA